MLVQETALVNKPYESSQKNMAPYFENYVN